MKAWTPKRSESRWREFLTAEEAVFIANADKMLARLEAERRKYNETFGRERTNIRNRAVHRARYAKAKP